MTIDVYDKASEAVLDDCYEFTNHILLKFTLPYLF